MCKSLCCHFNLFSLQIKIKLKLTILALPLTPLYQCCFFPLHMAECQEDEYTHFAPIKSSRQWKPNEAELINHAGVTYD